MARDMIRLSGKVPDQDIQIVYTGLRPGEKLHEELITHGEGIVATGHDKIMVLRRQAGGGQELELGIRAQIARLETAAQSFDPRAFKWPYRKLSRNTIPPARGSPMSRESIALSHIRLRLPGIRLPQRIPRP